MLTQKYQSTPRKPRCTSILSTTNPTWTDLESNPRLFVFSLATSCAVTAEMSEWNTDNIVSIALSYGLDGLGLESR